MEDLDALDRYSWSGHSVIIGKQSLEGQVVDEVLSHFAKGNREARKQYKLFVADGVELGKRDELGGGRRIRRELPDEFGEEPYDARVLGDGIFVEKLRQHMELKSKFPCSIEIKDIIAIVCRYFEIEPVELQLNSRAAKIVDARSVICYLAVRQAGHSGVEVGKQVNLRRARASVAASRGEEKVKNDPFLLALTDK
ncbi:MAG: hypothetical protein H7X83_10080 [Verrucomicrobia bacterium]|nr:hypothetical protein [Deltaproteobacteria bacterium]